MENEALITAIFNNISWNTQAIGSQLFQDKVKDALRKIASVPAGASLLTDSLSQTLTINMASKTSAYKGEWVINLDVTDTNDNYVDLNGIIRKYSLEHLLSHEMIHAVRNLNDFVGDEVEYINLTTAGTDYVGDTVRANNTILGQLNQHERISYPDAISNTVLSEIGLAPGANIYGGPGLDLVIVMPGAYDSVNISDRVKPAVIVGRNSSDTIVAGKGNDVIYGGGGVDIIEGGAGSDRVYGGNDVDYLVGGSDAISPDTIVPNVPNKNWDDGVRDDLSGREGVDFYLIYSDYVIGEITTAADYQKIISKIDYIDASDEDFIAYFQFKDSSNHYAILEFNDQRLRSNQFNSVSGTYKFGTVQIIRDGEAHTLQVTGSEEGEDLVVRVSDDWTSNVVGGFYNWASRSGKTINGSLSNDYINGGNGADSVYGGSGSDRASLGRGNDYFDGDGIAPSGTGSTSFNENAAGNGDIDTVVYSGSIADYIITIATDGSASVVHSTWGNDTLVNVEQLWFEKEGYIGLSDIEGMQPQHTQLIGSDSDDAIVGTDGDDLVIAHDGDDTVESYSGDDHLFGGKGNDTLRGGVGSDLYSHAMGDGHDAIEEVDEASAIDTLHLEEIFAAGTIITRGENISDAILTFSPKSSIVLRDGFNLGVIEQIVFDDDEIWDINQLRAAYLKQAFTANDDEIIGFSASDDRLFGGAGNDTLRGLSGSDTYVYSANAGFDIISDGNSESLDNDILSLVDLNLADITLHRSGVNLILTVVATNETLTVLNQYDQVSGGYSGIEKINFADGIVMDRDTILAIVEPDVPIEVPAVTVAGTSGNDTLEGTWGDDVFEGGLGNDLLLGSGGSDTYLYAVGDGNDYIDDEAGFTDNIDTLILTDLNATDISAERNNLNLVLTVLSTGHTITIDEQYYSNTEFWGIEKIQFANGAIWNKAALDAIGSPYGDPFNAIIGTNGNDTVDGTWGDDFIRGALGDDRLQGSGGNDIYVYASGDGNDYLDDESGRTDEFDILRFTDLNAWDISAARDGLHLVLTVLSTSQTIVIDEQYYSDTDYWGVEKVEFADGSFWDRDDLDTIGSPYGDPFTAIVGTTGNDTLNGTWGDDIIRGAAGDDLLLGDAGSDTYIYVSGDGNDYIDDESGFTDNTDVLLLTDLNAGDISLARNGVHLEITVIATGHTITIDEQFYSDVDYWGIEKIQFADGSFMDRDDILDVVTPSAGRISTPPETGANLSPAETSDSSADTDLIVFDTGAIDSITADPEPSYTAALETTSNTGEQASAVHSAEIISLSDYLGNSSVSDQSDDLWYQPEPIGVVV